MQESKYHGCRMLTFPFEGRESILVVPKKPAAGNPWVWRAEFFDAFPSADLALLKQGWHIAYHKVSDMYGCPKAIDFMKPFHDYLINQYQLARHAALFGFSRGGLYSVNYALRFPQDVACLYLDAPVLDITSWPAGFGQGDGAPGEWEECKELYGLTDETAKSFTGSPIHHMKELAATHIPVLLVAGDADTVVPYAENGALLAAGYKKLNEPVKVILKPGVGHHPHSLDDPAEIVRFILDAQAKHPA